MDSYLLDTNILSEAAKEHPAPNCLRWLEQNLQRSFLSTVTLAEIRYGIERLSDGKRKRTFARAYEFLRQDFADRIVEFDEAAASEFGRYAAEYEAALGKQSIDHADIRDLQIAATARAYGLVVVTRNTRHFPSMRTIDPFQ